MKVEVKKNVSSSKSADNSSAEDEDSDSFSNDSSSDSKINSKQKRKIPQFSVSQSDSVGLRMKISAIHRTDEKSKRKSPNNNNTRILEKSHINFEGKQQQQRAKRKLSTISSSSCCSVCSRSESECSSEVVKKEKPKKLRIKRKKISSEITHEVKCNNVSTDSDCDIERPNSNSKVKKSSIKSLESSIGSLQQNEQQSSATELLKTSTVTAEALPGGSCISSSDTELPALVNAAIKCVESCSESENHLSSEPKQYTSTLLRDFMVKTSQMLSNSSSTEVERNQEQKQEEQQQQQLSLSHKKPSSSSNNNDISSTNLLFENTKNSSSVQIRKKRGRPKKNSIIENIVNESADSGITSSITQSLSPSPKNNNNNNNNHHHHHSGSNNISNLLQTSTNNTTAKKEQAIVEQNKRENTLIQQQQQQQIQHQRHPQSKLNLGNLDKRIYAVTERVLYPQREKKKPSQRQSSTKTLSLLSSSNARQTSSKQDGDNAVIIAADDNSSRSNHIDPLWKKIDVNMKFRRPSLTGYKSDGGGSTICSKILAARSGYVSDYGSVGTKNYSGYKSDVSGKSRSSMRSCISRAKSCSGASTRSRRLAAGRKRRSSIISHHVTNVTKSGNVNEQDILQLAGLSLGQSSEESSRESVCKNSLSKEQSKLYGEINRFVTTGEYFGRNKHSISFGDLPLRRQQTSGSVLDGNEFLSHAAGMFASSSRGLLFSKDFERFSKRIRSRRSSAISRCSSYSATSRHDIKRRRRRKMRYRLQNRNGYIDSKLNTEIEILINSFPALCKITCDKSSGGKDSREKLEKDKTSGSKAQNKRNQKKKKQNDVIEHHHHQHHASNTAVKRRHKKTAHASPDDHKLPLKKRHYLLTPGEKSSEGKNANVADAKSKDGNAGDGGGSKSSGKNSSGGGSGKSSSGAGGSGGSKATVVTPKKRHLLETTNSGKEENATTKTGQSGANQSSGDVKPLAVKATECGESDSTLTSHKTQNHHHHHTKGDALTKKKNRLEGLLSKIQNANSSSTAPAAAITKDSIAAAAVAAISGESEEPVQPPPTPTYYPPPGVFEPTIELEIQIPLVKLAADGVITTKSEIESPKVADLMDVDKLLPISQGAASEATKAEHNRGVVEALLSKTAAVNLLLKRKRKKPINRTGFPSLKKKKRKVVEKVVVTTANPAEEEGESSNAQKKIITATAATSVSSANALKKSEPEAKEGKQDKLCDRVPHAGEASDTFLERNNKITKPRLSVVSLERLQEPQKKRDSTTSTIAAAVEQNSTIKTVKNNLRSLPNHRASNKANKANETKKKEKEGVRRKTISKDNKRTSTRSPKVMNNEVPTTTTNSTKSTKINNNSEVKVDTITSSSTEGKSSKRLTAIATENKRKTSKQSKGIKNKIAETVEEEAKTKPNKKLKKDTTSTATTKSNHSIANKKSIKTTAKNESNESQPNNTLKGNHQKAADIKKETSIDNANASASSHLPEELEQEPLPPLEVNNITADSTETETVVDESDSGTVKGRKTAKWKKNYLTAGLFSISYKSNRARKIPAGGGSNGNGDTSTEKQSLPPTQSLFPPPPYCEKFFRRTIQDFLLPYDVWWAYKNSKLPTKAMVPSWNYKKIRTNVYGDVRPNLIFDQQQCICKPEAGCGDDCLNRMVYTECSPANCPCGEKCTNQKIQKHEISPGIERFMTQNKGWGVRTTLPIRKGTYILEYVGEVVTEKEFKERMATLYAYDTHHYCLHLDGGLVIDGHRMGSDGRFVNHSCSPNCEMQKWSVNGLSRMALFALRDIEPDEELTYDYNFSLFNPSEGQLCRCETPQCRGVIGGKSQRVKPFLEQKVPEAVPSNAHSRSRKRQARKNSGRIQSKDFVATNLQQPSDREKKIIKSKNCFLIRNLEKVRKLKMKSLVKPSASTTSGNGGASGGSSSRPSTPSSLAAQISALLRVPRNIQTRVLTQAVTDPEIEKMAKLAAIFREICLALESVKDDEDKTLIVKLTAASKKKQQPSSQQDHRTFTKSIDFPTVQSNVEKGHYKTPEAFDEDVNSVFGNAINYFEPGAEETLIVKRLSKEYTEKKKELYSKLVELIGERSSKCFRITHGGRGTGVYNTHEDVIRCICGLFKDEGLMIQCSKCLVWQHTECTKANVNEENYLCERCEPRKVDLEIPLEEFTEENYRYYLSLLRGDLQIRQGDTVYVLRDIPIKDDDGNVLTTKKHTYETIGKIDYSECDIFRVERLWKDNDGKRFIFGHHYLRPHETFHEPSRKFYENEVVRVPLYEVIPIELVIARCWVLDRKTFCMGRPVDCISEEHVYICELRVNKTARLFAKNKQSYPICTKNYAFRRFKEKLHITRTYAPHDVDPSLLKMKKRKANESSSTQQQQQQNQHQQQQQQQKDKKTASPVIQLMPPPVKTINEKRSRLENVLKNLRFKQDSTPSICPPLDLSYLLTGRGARQRRANATIVPL